MGNMIAEQAFLRGADVLLLRGHNSAEPYYNLNDKKFSTVKDLFGKIKNNIKNYDIIIHAAAVSDFEVSKEKRKIKSGRDLHLELTPTTKILEKIKKLKKKIFLVGFKAEYNFSKNKLVKSAYNLLKSSNSDLIVANDVGRENAGFDVDTNEVFIVDAKRKVEHIELSDKRVVADRLLDKIIKRL